jgi:tRNA(Glu) U13 pseudouridine synthase TruD
VVPEVVEYELMSHPETKTELQSPFYYLGEKLDVPAGALKSLRVVLRLPKSAYATMAIREMCHTSSEFEAQQKLNAEYEQLSKEINESKAAKEGQ